jgi:hypothetical protein
MTPLAIAHEALKGDLRKSRSYFIGENYLYWDNRDQTYVTLNVKAWRPRASLNYISTVEEFINFKGDDMETVYTQEMADNGVLPSVGMECLFANRCNPHPNHEKCTIVYIGDLHCVVILDDNMQRYIRIANYSFKPLTPPIELIDGKAYQFESRGNVFHGIYEKKYTSFNVMAGQLFNDISCTNIKPLTVEGK